MSDKYDHMVILEMGTSRKLLNKAVKKMAKLGLDTEMRQTDYGYKVTATQYDVPAWRFNAALDKVFELDGIVSSHIPPVESRTRPVNIQGNVSERVESAIRQAMNQWSPKRHDILYVVSTNNRPVVWTANMADKVYLNVFVKPQDGELLDCGYNVLVRGVEWA